MYFGASADSDGPDKPEFVKKKATHNVFVQNSSSNIVSVILGSSSFHVFSCGSP